MLLKSPFNCLHVMQSIIDFIQHHQRTWCFMTDVQVKGFPRSLQHKVCQLKENTKGRYKDHNRGNSDKCSQTSLCSTRRQNYHLFSNPTHYPVTRPLLKGSSDLKASRSKSNTTWTIKRAVHTIFYIVIQKFFPFTH